MERVKKAAVLVIEPFHRLAKGDQAALTDEAERLVRFIEDEVASWEVQITPPLLDASAKPETDR